MFENLNPRLAETRASAEREKMIETTRAILAQFNSPSLEAIFTEILKKAEASENIKQFV